MSNNDIISYETEQFIVPLMWFKMMNHIIEQTRKSYSSDKVEQLLCEQIASFYGAAVAHIISWDHQIGSFLTITSSYPFVSPVNFTTAIKIRRNTTNELLLKKWHLLTPKEAIRTSELSELIQDEPVESLLLVPINIEPSKGKALLLGIRHTLSQKDAHLLRLTLELVQTLRSVCLNAEAANKKAAELESLLHSNLQLASSLNMRIVLSAILKNALERIPNANDAHIFLYENHRLHFGAALFRDGSENMQWSEPREQGLTYTVARSGKMIVVPDMRTHELFKEINPPWEGSIVGIPLKIHGKVVGVMTMATLKPVGFQEEELNLLKLLGDQAAISIENARIHNLITQQALTDQLTLLPNRRAFEIEADRLLSLSDRYGHPFSVMMIDLNGFKRINDTYGHAAGDRFLQEISKTMQQNIRKADFLARFGGDEFVLLLPQTTFEVALEVGNKLADKVFECKVLFDKELLECVSLTFGVAQYPVDGMEMADLLERADHRLYKAKQNRPAC